MCLVEVSQRLLRVLVNTLVKGFFGLFPELSTKFEVGLALGVRNCSTESSPSDAERSSNGY